MSDPGDLDGFSDATEADADLRVSPVLCAALSPLGRRLRMPVNFLPQQTADARGKPFNATIGQITDGRGRAVPLTPIRAALGGLDEDLANRALLYSPVEGLADLRSRWRERQRRGVPPEVPSTLPIVTAGRVLALRLAAELFLAPGRRVLLPGPAADVDVFCLRTGAQPVMLPPGLPVPDRLSAALAEAPAGEPVLIVLRVPAEPGGAMPSPEDREALRAALIAADRPVVVVVDDLCERGEREEEPSLFWDLAERHPNLLALKVDGADGLGFAGGSVGFLTFPFEPGTAVAQAIEDKVKLLQRAIVGSPPAVGQAVLLHELGAE